MQAPRHQPAAADFVPRFLQALFAQDDRVVVCQLRPDGSWTNASLPMPDAAAWLAARQSEPNLYFRASSHDGSASYGAANCLAARALFVDVDYGEAGHKRPSAHATSGDALACLLTAPARPSVAWHTGHGAQAA